jgi:hypothetical protein
MMKTDREQAGLRGPVRTYMDFNGDETEPMFGAEYSLDGRLLLRWHRRGSPGSRAETVYSYDDKGRMVSVTNPDDVKYRDEIQYDDQGRKTKVRTVLPRLEHKHFAIDVSGIFELTEEGVGLIGGGTITTHYNPNDQPIESLVRDAQGELLTRIVHEYNAEGRLIRDSLVQESFEWRDSMIDSIIPEEHRNQLPHYREMFRKQMKEALARGPSFFKSAERSHVYDQEGRPTEHHLTMGSLRQDVTVSYNEHGDVVRSVILQSGTLDGRASPMTSDSSTGVEWVYQYDKYDNSGNWIEKRSTFAKKGAASSSEETVHRRALTYY